MRIFRVDNPHTKPLAFWAWLIAEVQRRHPDVLFLAEAFTAPAMMANWPRSASPRATRTSPGAHEPRELSEYVEQLASPPLVDYMRPNFWPNTPDILDGRCGTGRRRFALRFVLAATLVPNYGIYSGFELCENEPASPTTGEHRVPRLGEVRAQAAELRGATQTSGS